MEAGLHPEDGILSCNIDWLRKPQTRPLQLEHIPPTRQVIDGNTDFVIGRGSDFHDFSARDGVNRSEGFLFMQRIGRGGEEVGGSDTQ